MPDYHVHEFVAHQDRREGCIICGRRRVWWWHYGPFAPYRALQRMRRPR